MPHLRTAAICMCATGDRPASVAKAVAAASAAAEAGADLITLPENYAGLGFPGGQDPDPVRDEAPEAHPAVAPFLALSSGSRLLVLGGIAARGRDGRTRNTMFVVFGGAVVARYRKLHLFEATLPGGSKVSERGVHEAGDEAVVLAFGAFRLGLSICYDLRFASLYQSLVAAGANVLLVPSAFTKPTGEAHFRVLCRARAIEFQSFVVAPTQTGHHAPGRDSYGHAMIVDPWGRMLADTGPEPGLALANLDLAAVEDARGRIEISRHLRAPGETSVRTVALDAGGT